MPPTNNAGHFFQTTDSIATEQRRAAKAKNKHGDPIHLPSKILAVCSDPRDSSAVYVSESAGEVKRIALESGDIKKIPPSLGAPLTSLAISNDSEKIYAGCWDKSIHVLSLNKSGPKTSLSGHADFIKCLLTTTLSGKPILISGGADSAVIVWDLRTNKQLHKIRLNSAVQDIAIDPLSQQTSSSENASGGDDEGESSSGSSSIELFIASSTPEIRRWRISWESASETSESIDSLIQAHDTSVYRLRFDSDGDLWTASADKTARKLVRDQNWAEDTVLRHPDFVRDVVVAERAGVVVTACRDEEVRVWDSASGSLVCTYSGHFEEVTGLALAMGERVVVSVGIDATVRRWSLDRGVMREWESQRVKEAEGHGVNEEEEEKEQVKDGDGLLTAEEEAELAELMDDDD